MLYDLFNLKTKAMKKVSNLSAFTVLVIFLFVNSFNAKSQTENLECHKNLLIQRNADNSIKRIEATFTHNLTFDDLVQIKYELQKVGITINYRKIEFDGHDLLLAIECEVVSDNGGNGSFGVDKLHTLNNKRIGFYCDYSPESASPFGTGYLN